jgi:hypothetical protein
MFRRRSAFGQPLRTRLDFDTLHDRFALAVLAIACGKHVANYHDWVSTLHAAHASRRMFSERQWGHTYLYLGRSAASLSITLPLSLAEYAWSTERGGPAP